ncbi:MAG: hypothetical protein R3B38_00085 [Patescibacteria group bacterium]
MSTSTERQPSVLQDPENILFCRRADLILDGVDQTTHIVGITLRPLQLVIWADPDIIDTPNSGDPVLALHYLCYQLASTGIERYAGFGLCNRHLMIPIENIDKNCELLRWDFQMNIFREGHSRIRKDAESPTFPITFHVGTNRGVDDNELCTVIMSTTTGVVDEAKKRGDMFLSDLYNKIANLANLEGIHNLIRYLRYQG